MEGSVQSTVISLAAAAALGYVIARLSTPSEKFAIDGPDISTKDGVHQVVRQAYGARVAKASVAEGCCSGGGENDTATDVAKKLGYTDEDLAAALEGNLGEGCGNPLSFAGLAHGETVVDLGSGAGIDCFVAGKRVGVTGQVIGVDMTPEMVSKARSIVAAKSLQNVEFRLGEIEHLPVGNNSVDAVISNCVINLAPDQQQVYTEVFRVLKPGGRLAVADVVSIAELPENLQNATALACWVSGAKTPAHITGVLLAAGFADVSVTLKPESKDVIKNWIPGSGAEEFVCSADITAYKPGGKARNKQAVSAPAVETASLTCEAAGPACSRDQTTGKVEW